MSTTLLKKTRKINKLLQDSNEKIMSFNALSKALSEVLNSNIYILNSSGKVLGSYFSHAIDSSVVIDKKSGDKILPAEYIKNVNKIPETKANLTKDELLSEAVKILEKYKRIPAGKNYTAKNIYKFGGILADYRNGLSMDLYDGNILVGTYFINMTGTIVMEKIKVDDNPNDDMFVYVYGEHTPFG